MMLPRPACRHMAPQHRRQGTLDPDRRVNMHNDRANQHQRTNGMQHRGGADGPDREVEREVFAPDHDAADEQAQHAQDQHVEQQLLAGVVLADLGQLFLAVVDHVVQLAQPLAVGLRHDVVAPHVAGEDHEAEEHHQPDERMQDAGPGTPPNRFESQKKAGWNSAAGQRQQDEGQRDGPVVGAFTGRVALDQAVAAVVAGLAVTHGEPPLRPCVRLPRAPRCGRRGRSGRSPPARSAPWPPRPAAWRCPSTATP